MDGAVAQLGERYNGIVEVVGSIPSGSTNDFKDLAGNGWVFFYASKHIVSTIFRPSAPIFGPKRIYANADIAKMPSMHAF